MRPSSAATKSATDLLPCRVWETTALTVASAFLTRWSSSASKVRWCSSTRLRSVMSMLTPTTRCGLSFAAIGNETARLDPSQLATRTNDAILYIVFAPALTKRLAAELFYPSYVVAVHASQAFAACYLGSAFRKAVDGRIAVRNLHDLRVGVIRVATNEANLCCQGKLYVALGQCQFRLLAFSNIDRHVHDTIIVPGSSRSVVG